MIFTIGAKVIHRGLRGGNDDRSSPSVNNFGRTISAWSLLPLSYAPSYSKAPASWTHSKRFATSRHQVKKHPPLSLAPSQPMGCLNQPCFASLAAGQREEPSAGRRSSSTFLDRHPRRLFCWTHRNRSRLRLNCRAGIATLPR